LERSGSTAGSARAADTPGAADPRNVAAVALIALGSD